MVDEMKEVGGSEHAGAAVKTKSSSGCLIIKKRAANGVAGVGGLSDELSSYNKEKKRARVVLSDSESSDEFLEPQVDKFHSMENKDYQTENNRLDKFDESEERRIRKDDLYRENGVQRESGNGVQRDLYTENKSTIDDVEYILPSSVSNKNLEEDFDEHVRLQGKNGVLKVMINKHKSVDVSSGRNGNAKPEDRKEPRTGVLGKKKLRLSHNIKDQWKSKDRQGSRAEDANKKRALMQSSSFSGLKRPEKSVASRSNKEGRPKMPKPMLLASGKETDENVTEVKRKESKIRRASYTEKQLLREKIKNMLLGAGWTIDYRPRRNRDYLDSVYISPAGTAYWSITKAYDALQKEDKDSLKAGGDFTPLPNEILSKLTRQTRKKMEREMQKNKKLEGNSSKSTRDKLKSTRPEAHDRHKGKLGSYMRHLHRSSESRLKETRQDSSDYSSDNSGQETTTRTNSHVVQGRKTRKLGRRTLLVRGSDKGINLENNEFLPFSGKRTMLSWLIDSGMVSVGEKVQYMNLRRTRVMQEGWITREGIHCDCCSKILTILRFELHAGSKLGQPFQNIFMPSGQSLMQCQIDSWNKQEESERKGFHAVDVDGDDPNDDTCCLCGDGGDLICCDGCPSTFHLSCLDMQMLPQGDWHCPNCACKYCKIVGGYGTQASGRTETSLLTCCLCEKKYHKSCSPETEDKPNDFPFCGKKCRELYNSLQKLLWTKHELDSGFSWSFIHRSDPLPDVSSVSFSQRAECNSKLAIALLVMDECFLPIVDRRSGINLIHNVIYNCGSNFSRLNFSGFLTAILERGDEIICAASIRIHGAQLAEMPFIGTRHMYRRQGMCSRLLHAIESALSSLKVKKLVIPAIEEHMHTWTNAFGFSPLEESCKQEMRSVNMLVFPGTDMLQKKLMKQGHVTSVEGKKAVEVESHKKPMAKESELNDTAMQNGDYTTENHSKPEILSSGKKSDHAQSHTNVLKSGVHDGNETTEGGAGADSGSKVETVGLQDGNETAIGITDVNPLQPQVPDSMSLDTISTYVSHESQHEVTAKDSVSVDEHPNSMDVHNGNVLPPHAPDIPLEPELKVPRKESAPIENDVQDVGISRSV